MRLHGFRHERGKHRKRLSMLQHLRNNSFSKMGYYSDGTRHRRFESLHNRRMSRGAASTPPMPTIIVAVKINSRIISVSLSPVALPPGSKMEAPPLLAVPIFRAQWKFGSSAPAARFFHRRPPFAFFIAGFPPIGPRFILPARSLAFACSNFVHAST
jgi:hypothetical protein